MLWLDRYSRPIACGEGRDPSEPGCVGLISRCPAKTRSKTLGSRAFRTAAKPGFSLIEFTVVLALMGLLAGIITLSVRPIMIRGKENAARAEIATISQALDVFYSVYGRYPTNDEGLAILSAKTDKAPDGFLKQTPIDPWGHPYQYNIPGRTEPYEVICFGADGKEGGDGADADISSSDLKEHAHPDGSH